MDIGSLLVNIAGNLMMHLLEIIGDLISLMTAVFSMNFFNIGKNSGEIFMLIFNWTNIL